MVGQHKGVRGYFPPVPPKHIQLDLHFPMDIINEELWKDVVRNANEVKLLRLEYKLGIGNFKRPIVRGVR